MGELDRWHEWMYQEWVNIYQALADGGQNMATCSHTHSKTTLFFGGGGLERPCGPATRQRDASLTFHRSLSPPGFYSHFKLRGLRGHAAKRHGRGPHSTPSPQNQNNVSPGEHQGTMTSSRLINPARPSDPAQFPWLCPTHSGATSGKWRKGN